MLVLGDFNEHLGSDAAGMSLLTCQLELVDLMASRHSSPPPATYSRGTKRLDYALGSAQVSRALRRCGYEAFSARFHSDHRGYHLDFDTEILFGTDTQRLAERQPRILASNNVHQVTAYISRKHALLEQHNVFQRAQRLHHPGNRHKFAEKLDKDIVAASLASELSLPRFDTPDWSVELAQARRHVIVLSKALSEFRTGFDHAEILRADLTQLPEDIAVPTNHRECSQQLRQANQRVKQIVAASCAARDHEREQRTKRLEESASTHDRNTAKMLRRLKKAEDLKNLFWKLKYARAAGTRQGVTRIEIPVHPEADPKTCTEWQQIEVPTEILQHLQRRNRIHFGQAHGTPFTIPPLSDDLGYRSTGQHGEQILNGSYDTTPLATNVRLLIHHLAQVHELADHPIRPTITESEFVGQLRAWTESTTTSPSGLHLGHYKALIARHSHSTTTSDEDLSDEFIARRDELDRMQADIRHLHLDMVNYALERGYSYQRWQLIANTILFKDTDNVRIHRTRVIHIFEASFPILRYPKRPLPHMEVIWLASLRSFLSTIDASVLLDDPSIPQMQRAHDAYIMDLILESKKFSNAEIRRLNYCRLYLQATTLSDLSQTSGTSLDQSKLVGTPSLLSSVTVDMQVYQERPSQAEWRL